MKFKVGDRVKAINYVDGINMKGMVGKVVYISGFRSCIGVDFDKSFSRGHDCDGYGRAGHCRNAHPYEIELYNNEEKNGTFTNTGKKFNFKQ